MDNIIFINKYVKFRGEYFGGLILFNSRFYILNKEDYDILTKIRRDKYLSFSSFNKSEKESIKRLLECGILLKIGVEKARKILKKNKRDNVF